MVDFNYLLLTCLNYYLPIPDSTTRLNISMAIAPAIIWLIMKIYNSGMLARFLFKYQSIVINSDHQHFYKLAEHYYKNHTNDIKTIILRMDDGQQQIILDTLKDKSIIDGKINIHLHEDKNNTTPSYKLIFASYLNINEIDKYIQEIIKSYKRLQNNLLVVYNIDVEVTEKSRKIKWKYSALTSNRTVTNNIVSKDVHTMFYEDLETFTQSEESYKRRGIQFKRGYFIHGKPGSGKSTLWESIANELQYPVFRLDMSIPTNNAEVSKLMNSIYDWIAPNDKHILLLEDLDRSEMFSIHKPQRHITMDSILNLLDGRGAHGRITIGTANNINIIKGSRYSEIDGTALFRPGRFDREIEINDCTIDQIEGILKLYFEIPKETKITLDKDIIITVAELNKVIQLHKEFNKILEFLNKFKIFKNGEFIEELTKKFLNGDDIEEQEIKNIEEHTENKRMRRIKRRIPRKTTKVHGTGIIEKLTAKINKQETILSTKYIENDLDYQIEVLQLEKLKLQLKKKTQIIETRALKQSANKNHDDSDQDINKKIPDDSDEDINDKSPQKNYDEDIDDKTIQKIPDDSDDDDSKNS